MLLGHRFSSNPVMHSIGWCSLAQERCLELTICIGIEYSPDRCELWTRTAGTGNGAVCVPFGAVGGRDQSQMRCTWFPLAIWPVTFSLLPTMAIQKLCAFGTNLVIIYCCLFPQSLVPRFFWIWWQRFQPLGLIAGSWDQRFVRSVQASRCIKYEGLHPPLCH